MKAKTISEEKVWSSPDGQRTIWKVALEADGKKYGMQTFSQKIATIGFEGDVETYKNQKGDTFVRQVPRENPTASGNSTYQPRDDKAIQAQMAIKAAIDMGRWPEYKNLESEIMGTIESRAKTIYAMIDRVKGSGSSGDNNKTDSNETKESENPKTAADTVYDNFEEAEPINLDDIPF
jgi:hypothetical protein